MNVSDYLQIFLFIIGIILFTKPLGLYIYKVIQGNFKFSLLIKFEKYIFKFGGFNADE